MGNRIKFTKITMLATMVFIAFSIMNTTAWAGFGTTAFKWASFHCSSTINGFSKKADDSGDFNYSCTVVIKELYAACRNKGKKADTAQAEKFQIDATTIQGLDLGTGLVIDGRGSTTGAVDFDDPTILAAVQEQLPSAGDLGCPNDNWQITFAVGKFDAAVELLTGAASAPNVNNTCISVNVSADPATACQPNVITNCLVPDPDDADCAVNPLGVDCNMIDLCPPASCNQEECLYFHAVEYDLEDNLVEVQGIPDGTDCVKPNLDFSKEAYDCACDYQVIRRDNGDQVFQPCQGKIDG